MPVENTGSFAYYQDPFWQHPGTKWDKDAEVNPKTGEVNHAEAAGSNLFEVAAAPFRAIMPNETFKGLFREGHDFKMGVLYDIWEVVGLPVIMAKDLIDAAVHGIKAGFSKPKSNP